MKESLQGRKVKVVEVTPEIAERWLSDHNHHNRPLRSGLAEKYAAAIRAGEWVLTAEPVAFCHPYTDSINEPQGVTLINGQHRLWAVVMAKKAAMMTVWWGCEPEEFRVIDQGKVRTFGDVLSTTRPDLADATMIASTATCLISMGLGFNSAGNFGHIRQSHVDLVLGAFEPELRAVVGYRKQLRKMCPRALTAALVLCQLANPSMTGLMANQLKEAVGFTERDPIRALHGYLLSQVLPGGQKDSEGAKFYKICHALCARMRGEHIRILRLTGEGLGWLRDANRERIEPVAREIFGGKLRSHFWEPKLQFQDGQEADGLKLPAA